MNKRLSKDVYRSTGRCTRLFYMCILFRV